jgi:tetratricopeptide (TPR) repeat protein
MPGAPVHRGSGWGAFERAARDLSGDAFHTTLRFDPSCMGEDERAWLRLLSEGHLPERDPEEEPIAHLVAPYARHALERATSDKGACAWNEWYHLGVILAHDGETEAAKRAFEASIAARPSAWAHRCLAAIAEAAGDGSSALGSYRRSMALRPHRALAIETARCMLAQDPAALPDWIPGLPAEIPRIRLILAAALVRADRLDEADEILASGFTVPDIREGEVSLTDLWFELQARRAAAEAGSPYGEEFLKAARRDRKPPAWLDFRMSD